MQILNPAYLGLSLLAAIPLLLYFFRRKSKTVEVSTLVFFKSLAREHQESAWLRHLKKLLSLLLTLIVVFGAIFGLSKIVFSPKADDIRSVVILLDRSASMAATGDDGRDRLEVAKEEIRARLDALPENVEVSLVAYDSRPEVLQPLSVVRRELLRKLRDVELRPVEDKFDAALAAAKMTASLNTPSVIWHASDRISDEELPAGVRADPIDAGLGEAINVGITAFEIRKVPLVNNEYEAFIEITSSASAPEPVEVTLETFITGVMANTPRKLDLGPGEKRALVMPIKEAASGQLLELRLTGLDNDCFSLDDSVVARLPESRPLVAVYVSESAEEADPFTRLALQAIAEDGTLDIYMTTGDKSLPSEDVDVFLFDGFLPSDWPADRPAIVINPPGAGGAVRAVALQNGIPHESVRVTNPEHPVLFRVSNTRVALTQTVVLDTSGSLEPLWFAGEEPVLAAGEVAGQRIVIFGFSPMQSENLPLMASYPLLLENSMLWCTEEAAAEAQMKTMRTGSLLETDSGSLSWTQIQDGVESESTQELQGRLVELDRIGVWKTADDKEGSSLLLSAHETNFPPPAEYTGVLSAAPVEVGRKSLFRGDITWLFLWAILVVLIIESYLFHRHSVY